MYQNRLTCAGGFISDEQVKEVCTSAINRIIRDRKLIKPPVQETGRGSAEYRELERSLEQAKEEGMQGASLTDMTALLYERAEVRYRTLEIRDAGFRTEEMQEILAGREELKEFNEALYRKLIKQLVVHKDNTVKVVFLNGSSIKIGYGEP